MLSGQLRGVSSGPCVYDRDSDTWRWPERPPPQAPVPAGSGPGTPEEELKGETWETGFTREGRRTPDHKGTVSFASPF